MAILIIIPIIFRTTGAKMSEALRSGLLETLQELLEHPEDGVRVHAGAALGALCQVLSTEELQSLLKTSLLGKYILHRFH